jgi:methionine-rich copper-binding protein CopC
MACRSPRTRRLSRSGADHSVIPVFARSAERTGCGAGWPPQRWRRLASLGLVIGLAPTLAWGHAALVKSTPAPRATLIKSPDRVRLWFNEPLETKFARVSVWDGQGRQIDQEDARVGPDDPKALSVGIPALGPGAYTVRYRVLSVDGHVVEGSFRFTVRAQP